MSRSRRQYNTRHILHYMLAAAILIAICSAWWHSCHATASSISADTPTDQLMKVKMPPSTCEHIIQYPGFKVSFNTNHHQPNYSAWELTAAHLDGDIKRLSKFESDPDVPGCATTQDYRNSGYDRGHMAPAGDMKWSQEAMHSCFFLTNICPQAHSLNAKAWKNLEEKCRQWARRDSTLIIICGPILTDRLTKTIGKTQITVPDRYFKVILAPYADPPRAIGFIMPNGHVPGGIQQAAVSVDQVEATTGMDFFSSLPDDIEEAIEAQCNFPLWERKSHR